MANIADMDALFSKNVEDKEVFFKKIKNTEGVVEGREGNAVGDGGSEVNNAEKGEGNL